MLLKIADLMEANTQMLAVAETIDNGKPIRESIAADVALAVDHFRYFAGCIRAEEGHISEIDHNTYAYHIPEPLGVVGQIISVELPVADGSVETGSGAGRWQLRCAQAGRTDPGLDHGVHRTGRPSAAAGRGQHCQRLRP